jgi:molybdopterin-guanine dinucleotide biosynthesis protein A
MIAISTTLRYLNEHEIYFLVKRDIPTLDTEWTLRLFQHSLNNSPFCPPVIAAFTNILK